MIAYYEHVSPADVRAYFDGHKYAYSTHYLTRFGDKYTVVRIAENPRLMRCSIDKSGTARIFLGRAGDAIADTSSLPVGINAEWQA